MRYKLFVFDLDETLWDVSEGLCSLVTPPFRRPEPDRIENEDGLWIQLKPGVRELFRFLKRRDCYVSVASRNDQKPVLELLEALELSEFLDFPQLGWRSKEDSIKRIIRHLQKRDNVVIAPEEVFFLDDWPENVVPVRAYGATALLFGQDVQDYAELLRMLK